MRYGTAIVLCSGLLGVMAGGCDLVGGFCSYRDTGGTATIVALDDPQADESNCENDPVRITFDFAPADPALAELAASNVRLTIAGGTNPPQTWAQNEGLTVGSQHNAIRRDITRGTCTPVLFELTDVDSAAAVSACYP